MVRPGEKVIVLGDLELSRVPGAVLGGSAEVVEIDVDELSEAVD